MEGHTNNVSFAVFHPNLPIILSGSEDGTVKGWNSGTYRVENTLSYSLERAWCVALRRDANEVAVGFDEGLVVIKVYMLIYPPSNNSLAYMVLSSVEKNPPSAWTPLANSSTPGTTTSYLEIFKQFLMMPTSPTALKSLYP